MNIKENIARLQDFYIISVKAPLGIFRKPVYLRETIEQMDYMGPGSFFLVFLVSLFIGMALSLQISAELAELGLKMYTGKIVGMAIIREIGPVAIALVLRVGWVQG
jgi:phospholipid/cholesterol/gamma-HCH transport system permease protein